jgi:hypothetical protein
MDLPFVAAMLRQAQGIVTPDAALNEAREKGFLEGKASVDTRRDHASIDLKELQEKVRKFEKASGVKITGWQDAGDIGEAVRQVLAGTMAHDRQSLRSLAKLILTHLGENEEEL